MIAPPTFDPVFTTQIILLNAAFSIRKFFQNFFKKVLTVASQAVIIMSVACDNNKRHRYAPLAQLVEHLTLNQGVQGSSP